MLTTELDDVDGEPVWSCPQDTELTEGALGWDRLGVGARCEAWLVWFVPLWCPAVVKIARPHQVSHPRARRSLTREVAALHDNQHPSLPRLYRDGRHAALPHVVLEYIDGPALDEEIPDPLDEPEAALLGAQLLAGLLALHHRGIAHIDVKPANVILRDMRPVLIDFGSARGIGSPQPPGRPVGTAGYAAPELEAGEPIAAAMDLYGLGTILHEAITGRPTFDPALPAADRPPPQPVGSSALAELILALLRADPAKRPTPSEALTTFADTLPGDLRPWPTWADAALAGHG
jgi:serine/threonine protein kinase